MSAPAVRVAGIGKDYWIPRGDAPGWRDYLRSPVSSIKRPKRTRVSALRDVSFEVQEGEVLGIIGRNGAGKSTLLKILSRITGPTRGQVELRGRIASLLEVGTGFHPDLTGRENVFLNGMLLGMPKPEIEQAFEAICEFAAVGEYIDVPIKRFSSGMQLRLAFAVAAHLAADTMIIDEVLAVGDAEFQRKCLGAMRDVSRKGRTTLFVSHNMSAVSSLCNRVIWLDHGTVRGDGAPDHVIHDYLLTGYTELGTEQASVDLRERPRGWCAGTARVDAVTFRRHSGSYQRRPWHAAFGESFDLVLECAIDRPESEAIIAIGFRNDRGEDVLTSHSCDSGRVRWPDRLTRGTATVEISQPWLRPGRYFVEVAILSGMRLLDFVSDAAVLVVDEQPAPGAPPLPLKKGPVSPVWTWTIDGDGGPAVG